MTRNEFDANAALMQRADAARTTGCAEDLKPAKGIVTGVLLGIGFYVACFLLVLALGAWGMT